jgi:competence protein ComEA
MHRISRVVTAGFLCGLVLVGSGRGAVAAGAAPARAAERVDLNSASADELTRLPGIGPAKAQAIIEHRGQEPFRRAEDILKVKGIGEKLYDQLKDEITVGDPPAATKGRGG